MADEDKTKKEEAGAASMSDNISKAAEILQKVIRPLMAGIAFLLPAIINASQTAYVIYSKLPLDVVWFLIGVIFCFFGGLYPTLFAAIQAAKHGGLKVLADSLATISSEAMIVLEESKKDDEKDDDGDGIKDVDQIDSKALMMRKVNLVITKVNPEKVDDATSAMYHVWISVFAVLSLKFARTISLALTISNFLRQPIDAFIAPTLAMAFPKGYKKWIPVILGWIAKSIAMTIAWSIQRVISAFTSALEGGLIMSRTMMKVCYKRGWTLWGFIPKNHEDTSLDETLSYLFAALGFYFQYKLGFHVPFPFNFLLFPFEIAESQIQWAITN